MLHLASYILSRIDLEGVYICTYADIYIYKDNRLWGRLERN